MPSAPRRVEAPFATDLAPMLATAGVMPPEPDRYAFELKWDGVRTLCFWDGRALILRTRTGADTTRRYPELLPLAAALGRRTAVLDGEIIAADASGKPSFHALQQRMHVTRPHALPRLRQTAPVYLMLFDLLHLEGRTLTHLPYTVRRERLESLGLEAEHWRTPPAIRGRGEDLLRAAQRHGLEGIVAKRLDSLYEPGRRSLAWIKIKVRLRQEFVIGGWLPGAGAATDGIGSLLLGYFDAEGRLRYAGKVGTGFSMDTRRRLVRQLETEAAEHSPFADAVPERGARFSPPRLVAEVEFAQWTPAGRVRHASFLGLRTDKRARSVVRETGENV